MTDRALKRKIHGVPNGEAKLSDAVYSIRDIRKRLKLVFSKYCVKSAYLFGDYAKRDVTPTSEVDILFESELSEMGRHDSLDFLQEIANTLGKTVNLLDARRIDRESKKEIHRNSIQIYSVNKQKIVQIILACLYALFSLFCISYAIHTLIGPDIVSYYAWVGGCTLFMSIASLTRTLAWCGVTRAKYKYSKLLGFDDKVELYALINVIVYLLASIVLFFFSIWLGLILLIAAIVNIVANFLNILFGFSVDTNYHLTTGMSHLCDIICGLNLFAVLIMTIYFFDSTPILQMMEFGGFVFPVIFYIKRKQFWKTKVFVYDNWELSGNFSEKQCACLSKEKDAFEKRNELKEEDNLRKKGVILKKELKEVSQKKSLNRWRKFQGRIRENRCYTASHKIDMRKRPNPKYPFRSWLKSSREQDERCAELERIQHLEWLRKEKLKKLRGIKPKASVKSRRRFKGKSGFTACRLHKLHSERRSCCMRQRRIGRAPNPHSPYNS